MKSPVYFVIDLLKNDIPVSMIKKYHLVGHLLKELSDNEESVFNVPARAKWEKIVAAYHKGQALTDAIYALQEENEFFVDVYDDIDFSQIQEKNLEKFVSFIDSFTRLDKQLLNSILDVYLQREGIRAGIFKESDSLIQLLVDLLGKDSGDIYDGTAGTNSFLIKALEQSKSKGMKLFAQEIDKFTWSIGKIMLAFANLNDDIVTAVRADALQEPLIHNGALQTFDGIISDPPFGLKNWGEEVAHKDPYHRYNFGIPPKSTADWAFISHYIASLNETGKAVLLVSQAVLFRGAREGKIREIIVKEDYIEAVLGLPPNLLAVTAVPMAILIINKNKPASLRNRILIVNAEESFERQHNKNILLAQHVEEIVKTYTEKIEREGFSVIATKEQVQANDYNLLPLKYFNKVEVETAIGTFEFNKQRYDVMETINLGGIAKLQRGFNAVTKEEVESDTYLINLSDVNEDEIIFESIKKVVVSPKQQQDYALKEGEILISSRGTKNTKIVVVPEMNKNVVFSSNFVRLTIKNKQEWHPYYVKLFLESPAGQFFIKASQTGSMVAVLSAKDIEKIEIPYMPYVAQKQLVERYLEAKKQYQLELLALKQKKVAFTFDTYESMGLMEAFRKVGE